MKLSEKLQKIRKENNITQEGLADKLNVSRQAVSKWESDLAYPDTEKLIQISKIFNISLDELINDNVDKVDNGSSKKLSFMEMINGMLEFISKAVNMFWSMKFAEKIKCLFEMAVLILIIIGIALLSSSIIIELIRRIFEFMPWEILHMIMGIFETLLMLGWFLLGGLIIIKIFKTRYLDYYVFVTDDNVSVKTFEEPIKELKEKKEYRVVIRDPKDSSLNIVRKIGKIFILIAKCFGILLLIPVVMGFVLGIVFLIFSIFYMFKGLFFNGISVTLLGLILFLYLVIEFIYNLIFNRKHVINRIFILFIISISLIGVGLGLSFTSLSNFSFLKNDKKEVNVHMIDMKDNLVIYDMMYLNYEDLFVDNSLEDIKIEITSYGNYDVYLYSYVESDFDKLSYEVVEIDVDYNDLEFYQDIVNNLSDKKIVSYDRIYDIKIYGSSDNLTLLRENCKKYIG